MVYGLIIKLQLLNTYFVIRYLNSSSNLSLKIAGCYLVFRYPLLYEPDQLVLQQFSPVQLLCFKPIPPSLKSEKQKILPHYITSVRHLRSIGKQCLNNYFFLIFFFFYILMLSARFAIQLQGELVSNYHYRNQSHTRYMIST